MGSLVTENTGDSEVVFRGRVGIADGLGLGGMLSEISADGQIGQGSGPQADYAASR